MRPPLLLLLLVLAGCGGEDQRARRVPAPGGEDGGASQRTLAPVQPVTPGGEVPVTVRIDVEGAPDAGAIGILGAREAELVGDWIEHGAIPAFWWSAPAGPLSESQEVSVPLAAGLRYFAVVIVSGEEMAGPGDFVGGPVAYAEEGQPITLTVERRFGDRLAPARGSTARPAAESPLESGAKPAQDGRPSRISTAVTMDFVPTGRLVIAGWRPGARTAGAAPRYAWVSDTVPLRWPLEMALPLPDGLDVLVALDLNGSGAVDKGDLATPLLVAWAPPPGVVELTLSDVLVD